MFGVQADDLHVETVEWLAENGGLNALSRPSRTRTGCNAATARRAS
jgi:hypothetical protein